LTFLALQAKHALLSHLEGMIEGGAKTHDGNVANLRFLVRQNGIKEEGRCDKGHFHQGIQPYCTAAALRQL
jgi:hypothetical protein